MTDRQWLVPCALLTSLLAAVGLTLIPGEAGLAGALTLLPLWVMASAAIGGLYALPSLRRMQRQGVTSPFAQIARLAGHHWRQVLFVAFAMLLAGLNMITFMWTKPLLNHLAAFWADPLLADIDWYLFLGRDPASLFGWLNSMPSAIFYHRAWFALMVMTLLMVLTRPPSAEKSALMLTYFLLWSLIGPAIHLALPAAGPVFYAALGYGDRFASIHVPEDMAKMSNYLWHGYSTGKFLPGGGISAMPSLHIATTAWMVIAVTVFARRWVMPTAAAGLAIFVLSISLGWHYAVDGIVGGAAALGAYLLAKSGYARLAQSRPGRSAGADAGLAPAATLG